MKYSIRSAILSLIINAAFVWLVNDAMADGLKPDYYTIGIGQTNLANNTGDGWWQQIGVQTRNSNQTPSWEFGAGWKLSESFDLEIGYRDLGKHSQFGSYVSDIDYALLKTGGCTLPCSGMFTIYSESRTYGGTVKLKYGPRLGDFRPTAAIGIFAFHSTSNFYTLGAPGKIPEVLHESENHQRPFVTLGVEYKNAFVEYTMHRAVGTENSPVEKAHTLHFGVRF
jgi:hypothetical protein